MEEQIKDLRRLVIKAYHMNEVEWGEHNDITVDGKMTVSKEMIEEFVESEPLIEKSTYRLSSRANMIVGQIR